MRRFAKRLAQKVAKLSDEQVEQLVQSLVDENDSLDAVIESLNTGLLICDINGNLLMSNKAAERFLQFNQSTLTAADKPGTKIPVWQIIADADIAGFLEEVHQKQKNHASEEFTVETDGGSLRFLLVSSMPLVQKRHLNGTIVQIDDITDRRNQETLFRRMESLASLTTLAANVAHEIKNPLGSISIHIQLIQKAVKNARLGDGILPDEKFVENYLNVVNEEIERLNKIVVDFLYAVRPVQAKLAPASLNEIVKNICDFIQPEAQKSNVELHLELADNLPELMLDEQLFKQIVMNLAQNAFAAMKNGGDLWMASGIKEDKVVFSVADNGEGMDEETCSRIFEPYFTTKVNGTGLGLTMVYKIIKEFGGDIQVRSFKDEGTIFTISLPIPQKERRRLACAT